ncbi:glycosyltransferase [Nonlabens dokdonensis]|uniref:glycosyltransferase n=1 Tax=Nonlabens dokdonensis TaxID=328515 RepID=UPI0011B7BB43|nr:glycosyltransferase [Nonlabens dokdonensis]
MHIVSFDIPYPVNYGGVIDVFHKIKSLYEKGIQITLHCWQYGDRKPEEKLEQYCKQVFYYQRKIGFYGLSTTLPYIVYSRRDKLLLERLQQDTAPILFEGLHTCYYLNHESLKNRHKMVRCHNIEHEYYEKLAQHSSRVKKIYFNKESDLLRKYEPILKNAQTLFTISDDDQFYFENNFRDVEVIKINAFHTDDKVSSQKGEGNYCLFHGSLNVSENDHSARYLVEHIFSEIDQPLIIAGKDPSFELQKICSKKKHVTLISNPSWEELNDLILNAQIHLMHASQKSGLKLKLLKALFSGRHVIANKKMATETRIAQHVTIATSQEEWIKAIKTLMKQSFTEQMLQERIQVCNDYSNEKSADLLIKSINY